MTKKEKTFERLKRNPRDVTFDEAQRLLKDFGFLERHPKGGSRHYIYYHQSLDRIVTLTKGTKSLPVYQVKDVLWSIKRLRSSHEER